MLNWSGILPAYYFLIWEPVFVNLLRSTGIDSRSLAGRHDNPILSTGLPNRLHKLAESIPWNRFLGSLNVYKFGLCFLNLCQWKSNENFSNFTVKWQRLLWSIVGTRNWFNAARWWIILDFWLVKRFNIP